MKNETFSCKNEHHHSNMIQNRYNGSISFVWYKCKYNTFLECRFKAKQLYTYRIYM